MKLQELFLTQEDKVKKAVEVEKPKINNKDVEAFEKPEENKDVEAFDGSATL